MKNNWTGERLETYIYSKDSIDHLHRYSLVSNYVQDKIVLDIASGEGYGSNIISDKAAFVYGVDIDAKSIQEAQLKYKKDNLKFLVGSTSSIPLEDHAVDVVVSFETIEHHDEHIEMMNEIRRVLRPNGLLIISTPDKKNYTEKRNFVNKFHVKELYKHEFFDLIAQNFNSIQMLTQKYVNGNSIIQEDTIDSEIKIFSGNYAAISNVVIDPFYLIAIASNGSFEKQKTTIFDGNDIIQTEFTNRLNEIYQSNSYKLGHLILSPFKRLKKIVK